MMMLALTGTSIRAFRAAGAAAVTGARPFGGFPRGEGLAAGVFTRVAAVGAI